MPGGYEVILGIKTNHSIGIRTNDAATSNGKAGLEMQKEVSGLRLVHVSRRIHATELREATTGRPVAVPRIWAVAEAVPVPAASPRDGAGAKPALVSEARPTPPAPKLELAFYRKYTEAMLRRYLRLSMAAGRVPSLLGRELFRGHVSHYKMTNFEDGVVFCVDVERCLARLRSPDQRLIQRIAIQGYTHEEAAPLLGLSFKWCVIHYGRALDRLTEIFLAGRLLEPQKSCQAPEKVEN